MSATTAQAYSGHDLVFDPELIRRFDVLGPRYTSYPTADRFSDDFGAEALSRHLGLRPLGGIERDLSLYFHIPFCNTVCYYCGCNKIVTKNRLASARYIDYLGREMALQAQYLAGERKVAQMHWGGGTPTFLSVPEIRQLMGFVRQHFDLRPEGEYSIEIDPRKVTPVTVAVLSEVGFNRMSLGVQDFDPMVQQAVNRIQSYEETKTVIDAARSNNFKSISLDLIYGLPHQTVERFAVTLDKVLAMQPDRISLYSYAHLPTKFMPQRRIATEDLPSAENKMAIFAFALKTLLEAGYVYIGMDHFARPDDELAIAQMRGSLHRNFQGYSTHSECDLLAFGVSAIGEVGGAYTQNQRELEPYYAALDRGELPVMRGYVLSRDDLARHAIIQSLMCHFELSFEAIGTAFDLDFREAFAYELRALQPLAKAGLLRYVHDGIEVTDAGRLLVRIIAMVFDRHLRQSEKTASYSKVI